MFVRYRVAQGKKNLSTHLISEIFNLKNIDPNLRSQTDFKQDPVNTLNYGLKSLRYLVPKIWNIILIINRKASSLTEFTTNIISSIHKHCPYIMSNLYPSCKLYRLSLIIEICF